MTDLSTMSAADLFERGIAALELELRAGGAPEAIVEQAVASMRSDYDATRAWLQTIERSAKRRNQFPGFRVVPFRKSVLGNGCA
ncbi:hypothetical protein [Paraburkholderia haematera]|nr:hypothetical protein [Paraburkholderia haematera]